MGHADPIGDPGALAVALLTATAGAASGQAPGAKPFTERVDVHRVLLDVRVTDGVGEPIEELTKADFVVRIDGKPVAVRNRPPGWPAPCAVKVS